MPPVLSMARMTGRSEEFWDDLLAFMEEGRVVPVRPGDGLTLNRRNNP